MSHGTLFSHSHVCQLFPKCISLAHMQEALFALPAARAVEVEGRTGQLHFHLPPDQSGQVLDRTWLPAGVLRTFGKTLYSGVPSTKPTGATTPGRSSWSYSEG